MALLHMTYDREPDIRNIKFLSWATVHQVSEADVRRYYKERTSKEAEGLKRQQIIQNADEPIKQEIEESPAPIIQNPEEEIKQEIDHNFAIPKIRKRRERLPIVSMQPSELPVTFKNPYSLSNIQVLKLKDFFEEFQFLTEERTSRIRGRIGSEVEIQTIHNWFKEQRALKIQELEKTPGAEKVLPSEMALLHMTYDREANIKNIKFLSWSRVHQLTEADVRRYYKERTAREEAASFRN
ncbi:hypothetical protein L3Y34_019512 [Caenorhabditis briggsae]|uniref:Homeobox domain-containing protein n=1 Tax=Caenorhabditis briggsae TaxID=6238 RepID=A0AAE9DR15_CAEBR|nr:hypothetical protein L3Y34_019512 [Caenorhabditis briggsae]